MQKRQYVASCLQWTAVLSGIIYLQVCRLPEISPSIVLGSLLLGPLLTQNAFYCYAFLQVPYHTIPSYKYGFLDVTGGLRAISVFFNPEIWNNPLFPLNKRRKFKTFGQDSFTLPALFHYDSLIEWLKKGSSVFIVEYSEYS